MGPAVSFACNRIAMLILSWPVDTWNERGLRVSHPSQASPSSSLTSSSSSSSSLSSSCRVGCGSVGGGGGGVAIRVSVSSPNTLYRELRCCRGVVAGFPFPRNGSTDSSDPWYRPGTRVMAHRRMHAHYGTPAPILPTRIEEPG